MRLFLLLLTLPLLCMPSSAAEKRNVILFVCDDLGFQLGCYGDKIARTPNIDGLAKEGVRFTHAFCTTASCSPSRACILSGLYGHANGQYGLQHSTHHFQSHGGVQSLPVLLGKGGYRTARIGKYHVAPEEVYQFDTALPGNARNGVGMAENCRAFLSAKDERPFFLYFCTTDPHRSGVDQQHPLKADKFGNGPAYAGVTEQVFDPKDVPVPPWLPDTPACRAELANYYQSIARVDAGLGRLLAVLKETGHTDDTLILFTSDNGPPWPGAKTTTYDPGLNLPLIVRAHGMKRPGTECHAMISWVDLTPTILDWCGVKPAAEAPPIIGAGEGGRAPKGKLQPYAFHGKSFSGVWDEEKPADRGPIFASHTFHEVTMYYPVRVIRTERYKLSLNLAHELSFPFASDLFEGGTWQDTLKSGAKKYGKRTVDAYLHRPQYELYDLEKDPDELSNLATDPAYKATFDDLAARLKTWQKATRDPWMVKYEHE
jgi:N-sulfoglucosamine sulfohydrolase